MTKVTKLALNEGVKIVHCFALYQGVTVYSVHPSLDDAIEVAKRRGFTVKRESLTSCVFDGTENIFGSAGGVTPCSIVPSEIIDGYWCVKGAEGENSEFLHQAFDYFPQESWMLAA